MSNSTRNRSIRDTHSGAQGAEARPSHPQNPHQPQASSSSTRPPRDRKEPSTSSAGTNIPNGQIPHHTHRPTRHSPFWWDGVWYYLASDGQYYQWHGVGEPGVGEEGPAPNAQGTDDTDGYRAGDTYSRQARQGSGYFDSTQSGTEADQGNEEWYPDIQEEFLHGQEAWTPLRLAGQPVGFQFHGDMNGDVAHMGHVEGLPNTYAPSLDLESEDTDGPAPPNPQP